MEVDKAERVGGDGFAHAARADCGGGSQTEFKEWPIHADDLAAR
jgi:hypothetical protein